MKVNQKAYIAADGATPFEVQEIDGRTVEMFLMNDFENIYNEFTSKARFAVWSSLDGVSYRLFIEKGYYEKLKDLYGKNINTIWLEFWDDCERISSKFTKVYILPITLLAIALYFVGITLIPEAGRNYFVIGIIIVFLIALMILNKMTKGKIANKNVESIEKIKKNLGNNKFEQLLEAQRSYTDEFFGYEEVKDENDEETVADEAKEEIKTEEKK